MTDSAAWHEKYPAPRHQTPEAVTPQELLSRIRNGQQAGIDFLLVDLRRNDHEGGTIKGSVNLPAQSLYPSLKSLLSMVARAKIPEVIWYCGSSRGRGSRAAGWFADLIEDEKLEGVRSVSLEGGIKAWAASGEDYTEMMSEYDEMVWDH